MQATADETRGTLQEVTVTAQRRSESLQQVPIAITAETAADVQRLGIHNLGSLASNVPGLTLSPFSVGQTSFLCAAYRQTTTGLGRTIRWRCSWTKCLNFLCGTLTRTRRRLQWIKRHLSFIGFRDH
jgi:hypothetical protein